MTLKILGDLIRRRREARGWSQLDMARVLGCTRQTIWHWENAKHGPGWSLMRAVSRELGISIEDLVR